MHKIFLLNITIRRNTLFGKDEINSSVTLHWAAETCLNQENGDIRDY